MEPTTNQVVKPHPNGALPNPTGKGGFRDNPQNISPGGWKKENVVSYQFKRFMNMSEQEFREFSKTPKNTMTMAERLAYNRVLAADKSLPDFKEIADRTEGKAYQSMDVTSGGEKLEGLVIVRANADDSTE